MISKDLIEKFKQIKCDLPIKNCPECQNTIVDLLNETYKKGIDKRNAEVKQAIKEWAKTYKIFEEGALNIAYRKLLQKLGLDK